ncbi:hypothetical protein D9M68_869780 [compost metagenome]
MPGIDCRCISSVIINTVSAANEIDELRLKIANDALLSPSHDGSVDIALRRVWCRVVGEDLGFQDVVPERFMRQSEAGRPQGGQC